MPHERWGGLTAELAKERHHGLERAIEAPPARIRQSSRAYVMRLNGQPDGSESIRLPASRRQLSPLDASSTRGSTLSIPGEMREPSPVLGGSDD